jgi:enoyl-CoA hydratase/carnithine racemase
MGLVSRVVPAGDLDKNIEGVLNALSQKSPAGMRIGQQAFHRADSMALDEALDYLSGMLAEVASTEDAREGITAFMEKRPPRFIGR